VVYSEQTAYRWTWYHSCTFCIVTLNNKSQEKISMQLLKKFHYMNSILSTSITTNKPRLTATEYDFMISHNNYRTVIWSWKQQQKHKFENERNLLNLCTSFSTHQLNFIHINLQDMTTPTELRKNETTSWKFPCCESVTTLTTGKFQL